MNNVRAFRAAVAHCLTNGRLEHFDDGLLLVENGKVAALGPAADLLIGLGPDIPVEDLRGTLLLPGFIDCHVHYPQMDMVASYGAQLLDWLDRYAYPEEQRFADRQHAESVAHRFADRLLANGTTTALVFATVHPTSADAMFAEAQRRGMRLITGKVAMDHACPEALRDTAEQAYGESRALIERWHGVDRLGYALTPRFALTSSAEQLTALGKLAEQFPDVHVHTHLAEHPDEVAAIAQQFPDCDGYLDAYARYGLLRERSVFAHCLHLPEPDRQRLAHSDAAAAFCPSSNLFLGSGLFDLAAARAANLRVGIGSDVGGGPSLNLLRTLADGYRVLQLQGQSLPADEALRLATLDAARALHLDDRIGNFEPGKEADFTVFDATSRSPAGARMAHAKDFAEKLFALVMLGDDRDVHSTWLMGEKAWSQR